MQHRLVRDHEQHIELVHIWTTEILPKWGATYAIKPRISVRTAVVDPVAFL